MDKHLHLFRHYHQDEDAHIIENNLTRALAIALKYDGLFMFHFLQTYLSDDWENLIKTKLDDVRIEVDVQKETRELIEDCEKLYAISLTEQVIKFEEDCHLKVSKAKKNNTTDLVIRFKGVVAIIEVKRDSADCKNQLIQQAYPFIEANIKPVYKSIEWSNLIELISSLRNFYNFRGEPSLFLNDFIALINDRFKNWIPSIPFKFLDPINSSKDELNKRLQLAMRSTINGDKLLETYDRIAFTVNENWASEIIPEFDNTFLKVYIWPGNTKQQGWHLYFTKKMDWIKKKTIEIQGKEYKLTIAREFKLCHYNRFISHIIASDNDMKTETHNRANFNSSGKYNRDQWGKLEKFLDAHLKTDWRKQCNWYNKFLKGDRKYLTISFGFQVCVSIPFSELQTIDFNSETYIQVAKFLDVVNSALINLVT